MQSTTCSPETIYHKLTENLANIITGQVQSIRKLIAAFASGGHVLLEDLPGTGKTTLAKALACSLQMDFRRIQFTPDLLPSDILGISIFDPRDHSFHFHKGPIFTEILLADEINRASPRTQSALLEAMGEKQVSLDGTRYELSESFFVIATQNPIDFHGTYPLPEAQMDRFAMRFSLGYVSPEEEVNILTQQEQGQIPTVCACVSRQEVHELRQAVHTVRISIELKQYIVSLVNKTRKMAGIQMGASPRAALTLMKVSQALALFDGMRFVTPDHVQEVAVAVIAHRLKLDSQAHFSGLNSEDIVREIIKEVPAPI